MINVSSCDVNVILNDSANRDLLSFLSSKFTYELKVFKYLPIQYPVLKGTINKIVVTFYLKYQYIRVCFLIRHFLAKEVVETILTCQPNVVAGMGEILPHFKSIWQFMTVLNQFCAKFHCCKSANNDLIMQASGHGSAKLFQNQITQISQGSIFDRPIRSQHSMA